MTFDTAQDTPCLQKKIRCSTRCSPNVIAFSVGAREPKPTVLNPALLFSGNTFIPDIHAYAVTRTLQPHIECVELKKLAVVETPVKPHRMDVVTTQRKPRRETRMTAG